MAKKEEFSLLHPNRVVFCCNLFPRLEISLLFRRQRRHLLEHVLYLARAVNQEHADAVAASDNLVRHTGRNVKQRSLCSLERVIAEDERGAALKDLKGLMILGMPVFSR